MKIKVKGGEVNLIANFWTWIEFKRLFGQDWNSLRDDVDFDAETADLELTQFPDMTDKKFIKLSQVDKDIFNQALAAKARKIEFNHNTMYAMAVAGGFDGTQKEFFDSIHAYDLVTDSELSKAFDEMLKNFNVRLPQIDEADVEPETEQQVFDLTTRVLWLCKKIGLGEWEIKNLSMQQLFELLWYNKKIVDGNKPKTELVKGADNIANILNAE